MRRTSIALSALAAIRLTRFVTYDTLGGWTLVEPATRWATKHEGGYAIKDGSELVPFHAHEFPVLDGHVPIQVDEDRGWRSKLVSGLNCPHCVGFWITAGTLAVAKISERNPKTARAFTFTAGSLGLSYVIGHISQRLDH